MAQNTPSSTVSSATPTDPRIAAMSAILAQNWWAIAIRGVCGIVFGLIALFLPGADPGRQRAAICAFVDGLR